MRIGLGEEGPVDLDLVADGPHALVAGCTGSGKSEALLGWLAAIAHCYSPEQVRFILIDYKGGRPRPPRGTASHPSTPHRP